MDVKRGTEGGREGSRKEGRKMKKKGPRIHEVRNQYIISMHGRGNEWRSGELFELPGCKIKISK